MTRQKIEFFLLLAAVTVSACGYRFVGGGSFPGGVQSVFVKIFDNRTAETGIENIFTNDLVYEITRTGTVEVTGGDAAESVMSGSIKSLTTETISYKGRNIAAERRLRVRVDLTLTDRTGRVIWSANDIPANETYPVDDANKELTERSKRDAIERLSKRLSEVIYGRLTSDF